MLPTHPAQSQITVDTSSSTDWKISNGVVTIDWLPNDGRIFSIHWNAFPDEQIIDQTSSDSHGPKGFYMDNAGSLGSGTATNNYHLDPNGKCIDWVEHHRVQCHDQCLHVFSAPHSLPE